MQPTKWINRLDMSVFKQMSQTTKDSLLDPQITAAQFEDCLPLLGEKLYNDINTNIAIYSELLDGGAYEYNDITYINQGLKAVLVHYAYARYKMFGDIIDTPFSTVEKLNGGESQRTSDATKKTLYQMNRATAFAYWRSVESYLLRTNNPLFLSSKCLNRNTNTFKIGKIK